jgi:hypothetical protein
MTTKLRTSDGLSLPLIALQQHLAILGKTGAGKSCTAKLAVEQIVRSGSRVCVLDPIKSDWWGMTLADDGVQRGLPFQILGGPRGHVALHAAAGKAVAEVVASGALPHSIIDMANFAAGGIAQFFTDFAPVLLQKMRGVLYLVIEEAHEFAPKERSGIGQESMAIHFAKRLAVAGRSKGIRLVILTQRTQSLHNALLGSCDSMIAHRLTAPADQDPVIKWLKANTNKNNVEAVASTLSSLKTGEGWLCCGEAQIFERRKFPRIATFDNSATPVDGEYREVDVPPVDVDALKALIGSAVAEAEANDPKRLKEENAKLRAQVQRAAIPPAPIASIPQGAKSVNTDQKVDALAGQVGELVRALSRGQSAAVPAATVTTNRIPAAQGFDEEAVYQRFKTRLLSEVSLGIATMTVTPPEKLRKEFQVAEAQRIVELARSLSPLSKLIQKFIEGVPGFTGQATIAKRIGRAYNGDLNKAAKQLADIGFAEVKNKVGISTTLRNTIATDLASYQPTDDEIEAVYQSVLYEIATDAN